MGVCFRLRGFQALMLGGGGEKRKQKISHHFRIFKSKKVSVGKRLNVD